MHCRRETTFGVAAFVCLAGSAAGADEPAQPAASAGEVVAVKVDAPAPRAIPGEMPQGELRRGGPGHPPIDQIPAMPLPHALDYAPAGPDGGMGWPVVYDAQTGEERVLQPSQGTRAIGGEGAGYNGADGAVSFDDMVRGFGTMTEVTNPGSFPWRMNVKVVLRFVDESGSDRFFVCSGTMADAETVLLAGHCVYAHSASGPDINDWCSEIWVYPGWDGVGNQFSEPSGVIENWGFAHGTGFGAFTGWTEDANFDWDMGLARVNRAVGMLTGWYGWSWGFGCSTIMDRSYNIGSFPSEGCGTPGLHTGREMYYWFGGYDDCPGNQLYFDTTPGCFTAQWGGMSGGGSYYFNDSDNRVVHAVVSNSNNSTFANHTKMWESFKDFMIDFENDSRGSTFDLQALQARYESSVVTAGDSIDSDFEAPNPTNANPGEDTYLFRHYLSTNDFISSFDTLLATYQYTYNYAPVQNVHINSGQMTIPLGTPSGDYWLGVELDPGVDSSSGNNNTELWDSFQVTVNGVADLVARSVSAPGGTYSAGGDITVSFDVDNQGGDPSNTVTVDFRLSTNDFISTSDYELGTRLYSGISGGGSLDTSSIRQIPDDIPAGTYYVGIIVDASDDVDSGNDMVASVGTITIEDCPADLASPFGVLDFSDVLAFLQAFGNQDPAADFATPFGTYDFSDVVAFLQAFGAGCP